MVRPLRRTPPKTPVPPRTLCPKLPHPPPAQVRKTVPGATETQFSMVDRLKRRVCTISFSSFELHEHLLGNKLVAGFGPMIAIVSQESFGLIVGVVGFPVSD